MSCLSFLTAAQKQALANAAPQRDAAEVLSEHPVPQVTEGTLHRIRLLAADTRPGIRSSAALHRHAPLDVLTTLAADPELGVRIAVARNENTPSGLLERLARDASPLVRGWIAAHPRAPHALLEQLQADDDPTVQRMVRWNRDWDRAVQPTA